MAGDINLGHRQRGERQADRSRGDARLCLRYGWTAAYRRLDAAGRIAMADAPTFAGLEGSAEVAEQLWNPGTRCGTPIPRWAACTPELTVSQIVVTAT